jgi:hypothetical protein
MEGVLLLALKWGRTWFGVGAGVGVNVGVLWGVQVEVSD